MTAILALEDKCALHYVLTSAWPESCDKFDQEAEACLKEAWSTEEPFLGRLAQAIQECNDDLVPLLDDCYDVSPSRLNFSTWSHLLEVVPDFIEREIVWLKSMPAEDMDDRARSLLNELLTTKEEGMARIRTLAEKQAEARAQDGGGEAEEAAGGGGSADSFRDADMPIEDRLAVAKGKDKFTQLWAAMAQTDCTACGYDCEGYAQAIADGEDTDLTKCVPGEDATANALKSIMGQ